MTTTIIVKIDPELEAIASEKDTTVEAVVNEALTIYRQNHMERELRERRAADYQALAEMWDELGDDVNSEQWLIAENEALTNFEKALDE